MSVIHIVSHTHWDREWYKPYQYFRVKLVYAMDQVIDTLEGDPDFKSFLFDGQTVVLEDYLEVKPENLGRLKDLISSGRLIVGPWYTQPDEFAPDGESLVRNLLIGMDIADHFGKSMTVGYLPDSFGQSCQIPQILKGFGIDAAVMMRGVPANKLGVSEFYWEALNGDKVIAIYLPDGYSNAMFLPKSKMKDYLRMKDITSKLKKWASTDNLLVMNGVDHQFIQPYIPGHIKYFNSIDNKAEYVHSTIENYIDCVRKCDIKTQVKGELIAPDRNRVHTSIASTRMYQKIKNRRSEAMLEKYTEPLCTIGWLLGGQYPRELINRAWKYLFQNQTHDGICGCCTDEVHREIDQRFDDIKNMAQTLIKGYSRAIASKIASKELSLVVTNNSMTLGRQLVRATVYTKAQDFILLDESNNKIEYEIDSAKDINAAEMSIWTLYLGAEEILKKTNISFVADFEFNLGYRVFKIKEGKKKETLEPRIKAYDNILENDFNRVEIFNNGSIHVLDKLTGKEYKNLHLLEDCGDAGDTYNYSPVTNDQVISSSRAKGTITAITNDGCKATAQIALNLDVPARLADGDSQRSSEMVSLPVSIKITLYAHTKRIDFETTVDNKANDHRLRALFNSSIQSDSSWAETQFGTIKRNNQIDTTNWVEEKWSEKPLPIYPMQRFVDANDGEYGLAVLNRGLTEYEIYQQDESVIAVTLLRGVGELGKGDLTIRPGRPSGIEVPTPDAQCSGTMTYEYAIVTHAGFDEGEIQKYAAEYDAPPLAVQNRIDMDTINKQFSKFIDFVHYESLKMRMSEGMQSLKFKDLNIVKLDNPVLQISAVKKNEKQNTLILRIYNPAGVKAQESTISFGLDVEKGYHTGFGENRQQQMQTAAANSFVIPDIAPYTAKTFEFIIKNR